MLGLARLDALDGNAETKPPDSKFAQVEQGVCRREGNAVVATDAGGRPRSWKSRSNTVKA